MKLGGGKGKGGAFEREVCKRLSLWVSDGANEDVFWRSAMSGGRATVGGKSGKDLRRQCGDISSVSAEGCPLTDKFYVECKHWANLDIDTFLLKKSRKLWKFWGDTCTQAEKYHKRPILIGCVMTFSFAG